MASGLIIVPNYMPALDSNGRPLPGALMYFYENKTTTPAVVYSDPGLETPHTNPLEADSSGVFPLVYASTTDVFTVAVTTSQGRPLAAYDDVTVSYTSLVQSAASPLDYGAVGDGVTDDSAALLAAMESGKVVDGRGLTYAISGTLAPSSFKGIYNCALKQLAPTVPFACLRISNLHGFEIDNVEIDFGGYFGAGTTMNDTAGIQIDSGSYDFLIKRVRASNGGKLSAIYVDGSFEFNIEDCTVSDCAYTTVETDDVIQGFWFNNCYRFTVKGCLAKNLGYDGTSPISVRRQTRGFSFGGCHNFTVMGCRAYFVDQGFDITGSAGNNRFVLTGNQTADCGTFGYKFANTPNNAVISSNIATRAGRDGFVVSGQNNVGNPIRQKNLDIIGCLAIDCGKNNSLWTGTVYAFRIEENSAVDITYPRGIRFINCLAIDDSVTPTTNYGFVNNILPRTYNDTDYDKNQTNVLINCRAPGCSNFQAGFHFPAAQITGATVASIASSTWTNIDLDVNSYDPSGMHNTALNAESVYVKDTGLYLCTGQMYFVANATGERGVAIALGGTQLDESEIMVDANPVTGTHVQTGGVLVEVTQPGQTIRLRGYQSSGGALNYNRAKCRLTVVKVA